MIGYYVHQQGFGHLARAMVIGERLDRPVTVLTSRPVSDPHPFTAVVELPRDDGAGGYGDRMGAIVAWVKHAQPEVFVVDMSVEVAAFVRLLGIPVVVMASPGNRVDAPHRLAHRMADQIIAAWPRDLWVPSWLRPYADKTAFVGGISRFEGRPPVVGDHCGTKVVVLSDAEGACVHEGEIGRGEGGPAVAWTSLGESARDWSTDAWPQLSAADLVITHAGQSCIADAAAAARPTIVIPQHRTFDEQRVTAEVLHRNQLAVLAPRWPQQRAWPALLRRAKALDTQRWKLWEVEGAASRAAAAIEDTARRCRGRSAS